MMEILDFELHFRLDVFGTLISIFLSYLDTALTGSVESKQDSIGWHCINHLSF